MSARSKLTGATHALRLPCRAASMETYCGYPIEILPGADMITAHHGEITCAECARVSAERPSGDSDKASHAVVPSRYGRGPQSTLCGTTLYPGVMAVSALRLTAANLAMEVTCIPCQIVFGERSRKGWMT